MLLPLTLGSVPRRGRGVSLLPRFREETPSRTAGALRRSVRELPGCDAHSATRGHGSSFFPSLYFTGEKQENTRVRFVFSNDNQVSWTTWNVRLNWSLI